MAASTSTPMEMAIPAKDIMFDVNFIPIKGIKDKTTATGIVMMGINAEGKCHKNKKMIKLTMIISSVS